MNNKTDCIVEVKNLRKYFPVSDGIMNTEMLKAVDGVSLSIKAGETLGLVGESGSGKSTLGRTLLNLYKPTSGEILYKGRSVKSKKDIYNFRRNTAMIFQDPYSSLDPRMTVADIIGEPLDIHKCYKNKADRMGKILNLMSLVGLNSEHAARYAHEFSGGQRQRIGIARSLALKPEFIVCDEPVSALDVSIQAQIINTLEQLQHKLGLSYLFIAHDLLVVRHISDRIAVMYLGRIVELSDTEELFYNPMHPYTQALLSAIPLPDPEAAKRAERLILSGDIPSPLNAPSGCAFRTRCRYAKEECAAFVPELAEIKKGHFVACHRVSEIN